MVPQFRKSTAWEKATHVFLQSHTHTLTGFTEHLLCPRLLVQRTEQWGKYSQLPPSQDTCPCLAPGQLSGSDLRGGSPRVSDPPSFQGVEWGWIQISPKPPVFPSSSCRIVEHAGQVFCLPCLSFLPPVIS